MDRCFVMPIKDNNSLTMDLEQKCVGILKIGNNALEAHDINPGDLIGYKPGREWEFIIDKKRIYCMKSNDIVIKYEYKGNEEEYNPSWAIAIKELIKVAKEPIIDFGPDISADRLKNAAATKKLAIFDALEILNRIEEEQNMLEDKPKQEIKKDNLLKVLQKEELNNV